MPQESRRISQSIIWFSCLTLAFGWAWTMQTSSLVSPYPVSSLGCSTDMWGASGKRGIINFQPRLDSKDKNVKWERWQLLTVNLQFDRMNMSMRKMFYTDSCTVNLQFNQKTFTWKNKKDVFYSQWTSSLTALVTGSELKPLSARHVYTPPWKLFFHFKFDLIWFNSVSIVISKTCVMSLTKIIN